MMKKKVMKWLVILFAALAFILWIAWGNTALETTRIQIVSERIPTSFDGWRIAQVSDLHNGKFGEENENLLMLLQAEQPDMIALTGDMVDSIHTDMDRAVSFAEEAVRIAPCYFVTGNHEARLEEQYEELEHRLEEVGVTVLRDEAVNLEREAGVIQLIGLDDPRFEEQDEELEDSLTYFVEKLSAIELADGYRILLSHRPETFDAYVSQQIDLVLTGHAHGGQFRLPVVGGLIAPNQGPFPKYDAGLYVEGKTNMVVSRGLGNSVFPFRVNNRPEVVIVTLCVP